MRVSRYLIGAPLDTHEAVLAHGLTGALDSIPADLLDWLIAARASGPAPIDEIEPTLCRQLVARGYLVEDTFDERAIAARLGARLHRQHREPSGFYLIPTYACQLRCPYCCQQFRRQQAAQSPVLSPAMIDAAFAAMERIGQGRVRSLNLYGGEPLLEPNHAVIESIVRRGRREGYHIAVVTNGVDADAFLDLLGPQGIQGVCITLDGPPALHNQRRRPASAGSGEGSFERIISNVTRILETGAQVALRFNVDVLSLDCLGETLACLRAQPWWDSPQVAWNVYPIYSPPGGAPWRGELDPQHYLQTLDHLQAHGQLPPAIEYDLSVGRQVAGLLSGKGWERLHPRHPAYCGSKQGVVILDPYGDLYTCVDAVDDPRQRVGRFYPALILDEAAIEQQAAWTPLERAECLACAFVLVCGGGCRHRRQPHLCQRVQATFQAALATQRQRMRLGASLYPNHPWL